MNGNKKKVPGPPFITAGGGGVRPVFPGPLGWLIQPSSILPSQIAFTTSVYSMPLKCGISIKNREFRYFMRPNQSLETSTRRIGTKEAVATIRRLIVPSASLVTM
jgi:hypothetical protein